MDLSRRPQCLAVQAPILVLLAVEGELGARERAVVAAGFVPDWNVRRDAGADEPAEKLAGPVGRIGGEAVGLQREPTLSALEHRLRRGHLVIRACGSGLDVD